MSVTGQIALGDNRAEFYRFVRFNAVLLALLFCIYYATTKGILDFANHALGRDFATMWVGAKLTWDGRTLEVFDPARLILVMRQYFDADYPHHFWSYPPTYLFLVLPFGLLPYVPAYIAWCLSTFGFLALALRAISADRTLVAMIVVASSSFMVVLFGHNGFVTAALLIGGCALMDRRPILAGILFGLLTFKPQLGLLIPVLLIARRNWMAFAAAVLSAALLALASVAAFGIDAWVAYFDKAIPYQTLNMARGTGLFTFCMPTWFMSVRLLGVDATVAYAIQAAIAIVVLIVAYRTFRLPLSRETTIALLGVGTFLATPQAFNYDMTLVSLAVLLLPSIAANEPWLRHERPVAMLAWALPWVMMPLGFLAQATRLPFALAPLLLAALFALLIARARHEAAAPR